MVAKQLEKQSYKFVISCLYSSGSQTGINYPSGLYAILRWATRNQNHNVAQYYEWSLQKKSLTWNTKKFYWG